MALTVKDRVRVVTTTTGTSDFTLGGAVAGYQSFSVIGDGNTTYYACSDSVTGDWEVGVGTYSSSGPTLSRDTVLESSNSGSKVSFAAGSKDVFVTYPAERAVYLDTAGSAVTTLDVGTLGVSTANITTANITSGTVSNTPSSGTDIANKTYVDTIASSGVTYHTPVKYEAPNALTATYNNGTSGVGATLTNSGTLGAFTPDGVVASVNDRILIYQQASAAHNGVYTVTTVGNGSTAWVLTRSTDTDSYALKDPNGLGEGDAFFVTSGNTGAGETYICNTQGTITFGTTAINFVQVSSAQIYSAGTGLTLSGTQFSITDTGTAGTYGSASSVPVLTTNAQGQVTSVTNTAISITSAAVSGLAASATTDTTNAANITSGTLPSARLIGSYANITGVGTLTSGTWNASTIGATYGGTGQSSYTTGDLLYASSSSALSTLADVATGNALISGGVGTAPSWGKVGLTTHVSGTLPVASGGTGATTLTGYVYGNGTGAMTASTSIPNAATTATSANTASAIVARDASGNFSAGTITASLSGNATSATSATSATTATNLAGGVAGAVPYQSGSGATAFSAAGTSGQVLTSAGTSAPTWTTPATVNNGTLTMAVSGTGLSGSASFTANQSGASSFTVTSNATNANTASTIVARDASGNFSAGTITATGFSGPLNGTVGATTPNTGAFTTLISTGNTTLGDASADTLTVNAGTWTTGKYTQTTSAGTLATGSQAINTYNITASGDAGGLTSVYGAHNIIATYSGANAAAGWSGAQIYSGHNGSSTITTQTGAVNAAQIASTGNSTSLYANNTSITLSNTGSATTAAFYITNAPSITSSGTIGSLYGLYVSNLGHANVTTAVGVRINDFTNSTNMRGIQSAISSGTNKYNLYIDGTADNYIVGSVGIGSAPQAGYNFRVSKQLTGATTAFTMVGDGVVQTDVTASVQMYNSTPSFSASAFSLTELRHFTAAQGTIGGCTLTNQYGFIANSTLTGATNNYGFFSNIASGSNRYNFYAAGTAENYFAGNVGIGTQAGSTTGQLRIAGNGSGATTFNGISVETSIQSGVTSGWRGLLIRPTTQATAFTLTNLYGVYINPQTFGAGSTVTNQYGVHVENTLTGATNNYGFYSNIASGSNRYNFYANGTADNYFAGNVGIGSNVASFTDRTLLVNRNATSTSASEYGSFLQISAQNTSGSANKIGVFGYVYAASGYAGTGALIGVYGSTQNATAGVTVTDARAFTATVSNTNTGTISTGTGLVVANGGNSGGGTFTNLYGIRIFDQTVGTNNYGIASSVSSGANKYNLYVDGTAVNYFAGNVGIGTSSPGYKLEVNGNASTSTSGIVRSGNGIFVNAQAISTNYTIAATDNGLSAGPVTINSGITVTVSSGAVWTVV